MNKERRIIISWLDQTKKPKDRQTAKNPCPKCGEIVYWMYDIWDDDRTRTIRIMNESHQIRRWCCKMNLSCRWAADVEP